MLKLSDIAATVHHSQQMPLEIVKTLKQNFKPPEPFVHFEDKVHIRTDQHYRPEKGKDSWRIKYNRHVKHESCGFYTPAHVPYESVGEVILDLKELVDGSLKKLKTLPAESQRVTKHKAWGKFKNKTAPDKDALKTLKQRDAATAENKLSPEKPKQVPSKPSPKHSPDSTNGGLSDIQQKIVANRKRIIAVKGGKPYFDCVRDETAQKTMEIMFQKNKPQGSMSPTCTTRLTKRFVSKLKERTDTKIVDPSLFTADQPSNEEILTLRASQERRKKVFVNKLNCLHQLLCSLYNLRTKDLRTKTPLSKDFLKTLRATIQFDHRGRPIRNNRFPHPQSSSRAAHHRSSTDVRMTETDNFPVGSPHMLSRPSCAYDSASSIFKQTENPPAGLGGLLQRKLGNRSQCAPAKQVEMTWEDLLEGKSLHGGQAEAAAPRNTTGRSSFLHNVRNAFRMRRTNLLQQLPQTGSPTSQQTTENLTLWQQVAASEKHNTKADQRTSLRSAVHKRPRRKEINMLADVVGENFAQVRAKKAQNVKEKLERSRVREKKIFQEKMKAISHASVFEKDIQALRQVSIEVHKNYEGDNVKPADWYKELTKEAETLHLSKDKDILQLLEIFLPFSLDEIHHISFIKAKLCLLIQSMPLYELCTIDVQESLHFLLSSILHAPVNLLTEWMGNRKIQPLPHKLPKK